MHPRVKSISELGRKQWKGRAKAVAQVKGKKKRHQHQQKGDGRHEWEGKRNQYADLRVDRLVVQEQQVCKLAMSLEDDAGLYDMEGE